MHQARYRSSALAVARGITFQAASNYRLGTKFAASAIGEEPARIEKVPSVKQTLDGSTRPTTGLFQLRPGLLDRNERLSMLSLNEAWLPERLRRKVGHGEASFDRQPVQIKA
jgi:hypothetical protein